MGIRERVSLAALLVPQVHRARSVVCSRPQRPPSSVRVLQGRVPVLLPHLPASTVRPSSDAKPERASRHLLWTASCACSSTDVSPRDTLDSHSHVTAQSLSSARLLNWTGEIHTLHSTDFSGQHLKANRRIRQRKWGTPRLQTRFYLYPTGNSGLWAAPADSDSRSEFAGRPAPSTAPYNLRFCCCLLWNLLSPFK